MKNTTIVDHSARVGPADKGFALVVTVSLLVLLSVIAFGFLRFSAVTYGDSLDAKGNVVARAWCEAIVQRIPDYVDTRPFFSSSWPANKKGPQHGVLLPRHPQRAHAHHPRLHSLSGCRRGCHYKWQGPSLPTAMRHALRGGSSAATNSL